jgi:hypothetical protein
MDSLRQRLPDYRLQIPKRPRPPHLSRPHLPADKPGQWRTTYTFSGNDSHQTVPFRVGHCWRLVWTCDPATVEGLACIAVRKVDVADGRSGAGGMQIVREQLTTSSVYEIYGGGQVCLHIISSGAWRAQVQEREPREPITNQCS